MRIQIDAEGNFNLRSLYLMLREGHFGVAFDADELQAKSGGTGIFGAGGGHIPDITILPKPHLTEEEIYKLVEKIKEAVGSNAHVHVD